MASGVVRRPLPALLALLALLLLTALVWWRVLHRDDKKQSHAGPSCPAPTSSTAPTTGGLPAPSSVTVQVINGTYRLKKPRPGIAAKARNALRADGFRVTPTAGNDTKAKVRSVAEIRYGPAGTQAAKLLEYYFPQAVPKPQSWKTATVTVSLGAKYTRVAPKATVERALATQHQGGASSSPAPSAGSSC
jgi:hypothetical protein